MRAGLPLIAFASATALACSIDLAPLAQDEVSEVKPSNAGGGSGGPGTGGSSGVGGGGGVGGAQGTGATVGGCIEYCDRALAAGCSSETKAECVQSCQASQVELAKSFPACGASYAAWLSCAGVSGAFVCSDGDVALLNCGPELESFMACWSVPVACGITPTASYGSCYEYRACNPMLDDCPAGHTCDWYTTELGAYELGCFPDPTAGLCEPCGTIENPFCAPGLGCVPGGAYFTCARYCCNDADCGGAPGSCKPWGITGLAFCAA